MQIHLSAVVASASIVILINHWFVEISIDRTGPKVLSHSVKKRFFSIIQLCKEWFCIKENLQFCTFKGNMLKDTLLRVYVGRKPVTLWDSNPQLIDHEVCALLISTQWKLYWMLIVQPGTTANFVVPPLALLLISYSQQVIPKLSFNWSIFWLLLLTGARKN